MAAVLDLVSGEYEEDDTDKPTLEECKRWVMALDGEFGGFQAGIGFEEAVYYQSFSIDTRVNSDGSVVAPVMTGSAPSDADAAIDSLTPSDMLIKVRPARNAVKYRTQAEKLRKFAAALWHAWRKNKDALRMVAADMVIRRVGIGRVLIDDSLWPDLPDDMADEPEQDDDEADDVYATRVEDWDERRTDWEAKHRRKSPIILEHRDPRNVRWRENSQGDLLVVVEAYYTTVLEARQAFARYPAIANILPPGRDENELVRVTDVWHNRYRCLMVEDKPLFPVHVGTPFEGVQRHFYSEIPYAIAAYREIPATLPGDRYRGGLTNTADLYPYESETVTMALEIMRWMAWRTYVGHTFEARDIPMEPGLMIDMDKDRNEYIEVLEGTAIPPEILQMAATMQGLIQRNGRANPANNTTARSAQQLMALNAEQEKKLDCPRQSLQRWCERVTSLAAMELEQNLDGRLVLPVPGHDHEGNDFGEMTITPKDVNGYYDGFEINFSRRLDPAVLEVNKALMGMAQNNYISQRKALELGALVDDPQAELDELLDQATEKQPWMISLLSLKRVEQWYGDDSWQYKIALSMYLQSQQGKQGGQPGGPQGGPGQGPPPGLTAKPQQPPGGNRGAGTQASTQDGFAQGLQQGTQMGGRRR